MYARPFFFAAKQVSFFVCSLKCFYLFTQCQNEVFLHNWQKMKFILASILLYFEWKALHFFKKRGKKEKIKRLKEKFKNSKENEKIWGKKHTLRVKLISFAFNQLWWQTRGLSKTIQTFSPLSSPQTLKRMAPLGN